MMMQRRQGGGTSSSKYAGSMSTPTGGGGVLNAHNAMLRGSHSNNNSNNGSTPTPTGRSSSSGTFFCNTGMLILLAVALTAANYTLFSKTPAQVQQVEHDLMEEARYAEQMLEQELKGWWSMASSTANKEPLLSSSGEQLPLPPPPQGNSPWVEGEQRLKRELQKLVALQEQGKELGVPVLTRWLGEDIPAWAGEGVDRNEWDAKVQARYAEMRQDEERWRERVAAAIQAEQRG